MIWYGWKRFAEERWSGAGTCPTCGPGQDFLGYQVKRRATHGWKRFAEERWSGAGTCPTCGPGQDFLGYQVKRRATLYRVPIAPLWSDWIAQCQTCGTTYKMNHEAFNAAQDRAQRGQEVW